MYPCHSYATLNNLNKCLSAMSYPAPAGLGLLLLLLLLLSICHVVGLYNWWHYLISSKFSGLSCWLKLFLLALLWVSILVSSMLVLHVCKSMWRWCLIITELFTTLIVWYHAYSNFKLSANENHFKHSHVWTQTYYNSVLNARQFFSFLM